MDTGKILLPSNKNGTKPKSWLSQRLSSFSEWWWMLTKGTFFVQRQKIKSIKNLLPGRATLLREITDSQICSYEIEKTEYYNLSEQKFYEQSHWATPFNYLGGALCLLIFKRRNKSAEYEFSLITLADVSLIEHVTGTGFDKNDFK